MSTCGAGPPTRGPTPHGDVGASRRPLTAAIRTPRWADTSSLATDSSAPGRRPACHWRYPRAGERKAAAAPAAVLGPGGPALRSRLATGLTGGAVIAG